MPWNPGAVLEVFPLDVVRAIGTDLMDSSNLVIPSVLPVNVSWVMIFLLFTRRAPVVMKPAVVKCITANQLVRDHCASRQRCNRSPAQSDRPGLINCGLA
jgi:hypothetical protein